MDLKDAATDSNAQTKPLFHGLIGSGLIGIDPFSPRSWSGISPYFFGECRTAGMLQGASGGEISGPLRLLLLALSWHPNRDLWRLRFYLEPRYRRLLSGVLKSKIRGIPTGVDTLQVGGLFDVTDLTAREGRRAFSYHDGNLAVRLRSPFGGGGLPEGLVKRALAYERALYHRLTRIFTMSDYLRRSFIDDFGVAEDKVVSIGAGANLPVLPGPLEKDFANGKILFVGADFARKGGLELLRAFQQARVEVPHISLHVVGPRTEPPAGEPLDGVVWHGFLRKEVPEEAAKLNDLFRDCSLFVLPSLYEPFGIAPVEAMLHSMPAIVSGDWALGETVVNEVTGLHVQPGSVESLTRALVRLLKDQSLLRAYAMASRDRALQHFTWPQVIGKLRQGIEDKELSGK